jgi:flagellar M-ring protein FliF
VAETVASSLPAVTGSGSLLGSLPRMSPRQILAVMVGSATLIAVAVGAWIWTQSPDYRVLYSGLSDRDGGAVISALNQMNVPYRFAEGGGALLVPADKVHDARLRLASQGLPKGSVVGFELVDNQKFGATQFQEQINYQRGLEGELARSIQSLSAVSAARVHLAIPKPSVFLREQQGPSASVLVSLHAGRQLDRSQVTGIINLVASSVPELAPTSVSVLDQSGNLLSRNGAGADHGGLDPSQLSYITQIETETIRRITDILEPIVGVGNSRVQVTADVDFQRVESVAETFKPNQDPKVAAVRTQQLSSSQSSGSAAGAQGIPGALSNQPPAGGTVAPDGKTPAAATAGTGSAGGTGSLRKDENIAYEVDKTIQHTRANAGGIKRLTAAIVVNHRRQVDKDGKATTAPLSEKDMGEINALVREAMGYSKERGDSINIVNTAFNEPEKLAVAETPFYRQPDNIQMAKDAGKYLLFALLIGYLYFGVLKPMLNKAIESVPAPEPVPALPGVGEAALLGGPPPGQGDALQAARRLAREDPKIVANVVKSWVTKDE